MGSRLFSASHIRAPPFEPPPAGGVTPRAIHRNCHTMVTTFAAVIGPSTAGDELDMVHDDWPSS